MSLHFSILTKLSLMRTMQVTQAKWEAQELIATNRYTYHIPNQYFNMLVKHESWKLLMPIGSLYFAFFRVTLQRVQSLLKTREVIGYASYLAQQWRQFVPMFWNNKVDITLKISKILYTANISSALIPEEHNKKNYTTAHVCIFHKELSHKTFIL